MNDYYWVSSAATGSKPGRWAFPYKTKAAAAAAAKKHVQCGKVARVIYKMRPVKLD